jgi:molybdate transport system regulatory protein
MTAKLQFRIRVYRDQSIAIGPGKVALLEALKDSGSISAAARALEMSYRRAWLLIDETNRALISPAVIAAAGGLKGGGAVLTPVGEELISRYREIEQTSRRATEEPMEALTRLLAPAK